MKKSVSRWIKAIVVLLVAGLFYAVYFTELGRPESSESSKGITLYNKTAIPTIFIQETQVPSVELDWAFANENLLKFAVKIRGLETNSNFSEWVCDPYITIATDKPIQYRLLSLDFGPVYDTEGEVIRATYKYEVNAGDYNSLKVDMDLTIGPCGEQFNFQENNITPAAITSLIGNYHLSFRVPVKISTPSESETLTPISIALAVWEDIPVYPGALEVMDDLPGYHYSVDKTDPHTLMIYYRNEMRNTSWKLLSIDDTSGIATGTSYALMYTRGKDVLSIDIFIREKITHVLLTQQH